MFSVWMSRNTEIRHLQHFAVKLDLNKPKNTRTREHTSHCCTAPGHWELWFQIRHDLMQLWGHLYYLWFYYVFGVKALQVFFNQTGFWPFPVFGPTEAETHDSNVTVVERLGKVEHLPPSAVIRRDLLPALFSDWLLCLVLYGLLLLLHASCQLTASAPHVAVNYSQPSCLFGADAFRNIEKGRFHHMTSFRPKKMNETWKPIKRGNKRGSWSAVAGGKTAD